MTSVQVVPGRPRRWPQRAAGTGRATAHTLAGLLAGLVTWAVLGLIAVLWLAAVYSLVEGPTGHWLLAVGYVVAVPAGPLAALAAVRGLAGMQRARFATFLDVDIEAPGRRPARGARPSSGARPSRSGGRLAARSARQLGYHLSTLVTGVAGGIAVALGWLLAAPRVACTVARADERAARRLLGPTRAETLARQVEALARSRAEIVAATDAERRRIERDLHDGTQQRLLSLAMNLGMARAALADAPEAARLAIEQAHDEATETLVELREFVRGLHPAVLNDRGLDAALSGIVARAPLPVELRVDLPRRCAPSIEAIAYFVVSEALTNVVRHAAASRAGVVVERVGERLRVVVSDDGRGGAASPPADDPAPGRLTGNGPLAGGPAGGSGLRGLAQRAAAVDGTMTVVSPVGGPTSIIVELPCE
ncbi:histidine kinase [Parafrankia sp. Ea1.12]|uniref:sensor histidine kinase n=1 Tax=Parafrankia sp. Ea1.12 TaxID=573499 RepID=UPI001F19E558|nr:histidine kinase [Parafrankia sp. Ea1.12]